MLGAFQGIVRRGGLHGLGSTLISQRPALVNKSVLTQLDLLILLRLVAGNDQDAVDKNYISAVEHEGAARRADGLARVAAVGEAWFFEPGAEPAAARARAACASAGRSTRPRRRSPASSASSRACSPTSTSTTLRDRMVWLEQLGIVPADKTQAGFIAGYKPKGGRFANLLGGLRRDGLVEYPQAGQIALTDAGRALGRDPGLPRTDEALHAAVLARLDEPQGRLMRPILAAWPNRISRADVAAEADYDAAGGRFANLIGSLRTLGLIEYPAPGQAKARDILFPQSHRS
jgi:hypothetical protein